MECIALIMGRFAADGSATGLMGSDSPEASIERQFREVLRIARTSLFTEQTLNASGSDDRTAQARA